MMRSQRLRSEHGAVAVTVALLMIPLLVLSAFAIDFGNAYSQARALSTGADSAALAMIRTARTQGSATAAQTCDQYRTAFLAAQPDAKAFAATYVNLNAPFGRPLTAADIETADIRCSGGTLVAEVSTKASVNTSLGKFVGVSALTARKDAQAAMNLGGKADCGLCVLGSATHDTQNGDISVVDGNVSLNGSGESSPNGTVSVTATNGSITIQGTYSPGHIPWSPDPILGVSISDPLAALPMPPNITGLMSKKDICNDGPGIYPGIDPGKTSPCTLTPGMYVIVGGTKYAGKAVVVAKDVTFYFTCGTVSAPHQCTSADAVYDSNLDGQGAVTVTAPSTATQTKGSIPGMAILADRGFQGTISMGGNAGSTITGTVYAKAATLAFNGNGASYAMTSLVIVDDFEFAGNNAHLDVTYTLDANVKVPPGPSRLTD